jgi:hypothetical protein
VVFGDESVTELLELPRNQAVISDGLGTAEQILAGVSPIDQNANGSVCVQLSHGLEVGSAPFGTYMYTTWSTTTRPFRNECALYWTLYRPQRI